MNDREFYVIVNTKTLLFCCKETDNYTGFLEKAMQFDNFFDCKDELESYDDDVRDNFKIYKVTQKLETNFEKMETF